MAEEEGPEGEKQGQGFQEGQGGQKPVLKVVAEGERQHLPKVSKAVGRGRQRRSTA